MIYSGVGHPGACDEGLRCIPYCVCESDHRDVTWNTTSLSYPIPAQPPSACPDLCVCLCGCLCLTPAPDQAVPRRDLHVQSQNALLQGRKSAQSLPATSWSHPRTLAMSRQAAVCSQPLLPSCSPSVSRKCTAWGWGGAPGWCMAGVWMALSPQLPISSFRWTGGT